MAPAKILMKKAGKKTMAKKEKTGKKAAAKQQKPQQKKGPSLKDQVVEIQTVLKSVKTPSTDLLVKIAELLKQPARSEFEGKLLEAVQLWFHDHQGNLHSQSQARGEELERQTMEAQDYAQHAQAAAEALAQASAELQHAAVELPHREQELKTVATELQKHKKQNQALAKTLDTLTKNVADYENAKSQVVALLETPVPNEGENPHKTKQWKSAVADISKAAKAGGCDQNMNDTACKVLATGLPFSAFAQTVIASLGEFLDGCVSAEHARRDAAQQELEAHNAAFPHIEAVHQSAVSSVQHAQEVKAQCEATLKAAKKEHKARVAEAESHGQKLTAAQKEHAAAEKVKEQCEAAAATFDKLNSQPMDEGCDADVEIEGCDADVEIVGESNLDNEPTEDEEVPY